MADSKAAAPTAGEPTAAPSKSGKKKGKRLIVIAAALVLLGGGGAAAYLRLRPSAPAADAAGSDKGGDKGDNKSADGDKKAAAKKPTFVEFEPFTVNLKDADKVVQVKLTFQVDAEKVVDEFKDLSPIVRSAVIPVLSTRESVELMTSEGKDKLCKDLATATNAAVASSGLKDPVEAVLITHMLIQ